MAIIPSNVSPILTINRIKVQIFNHTFIFLEYTMKNQILHLAIFFFALLATENLQIHFFFESLIFNFSFWRNVVSKSNAASSSSPLRARHPARQRGPARASVRPSVCPPARYWQAWLAIWLLLPQATFFFFPPLICQIIVAESVRAAKFSLVKTYQNSLSLTASVITTFCLFVHSEYWTLTSF